jgi:hypothetical protein
MSSSVAAWEGTMQAEDSSEPPANGGEIGCDPVKVRAVAHWIPRERYVTRDEMALLMRVSVKTVDRLTREGMPSETWGRRTRRFLPSVALEWASKNGCER